MSVSKIQALTLLALLGWCGLASAQTTSEGPPAPPMQLPTVDTVKIDNQDYKCLNVDQWKAVLLIANDYQSLYRWRLITQGTLDAYKVTVTNYDTLINNYLAQIKLLQGDRDYLQLRLNSELDAAKKVKTINNIERGILWGVISVETIMLGVFGVRAVAVQ